MVDGQDTAGESEVSPASRVASELIDRVTLELGRIAAIVESIGDALSPTIELLEAGYAIQTALVVLNDWSGGQIGAHRVDSLPLGTRMDLGIEP